MTNKGKEVILSENTQHVRTVFSMEYLPTQRTGNWSIVGGMQGDIGRWEWSKRL